MHYYVLTLFTEMITNACGESILGRASQKGLISVEAINIRDYSTNKHNRVDDYPYGGGAGMVMQPMPVYDAWKDLTERIGKKPRVLFLTRLCLFVEKSRILMDSTEINPFWDARPRMLSPQAFVIISGNNVST